MRSCHRETDVLVSPGCDSLHTQPPKARRVPIRRKRHYRWNKNRSTGESIKGFAPLCLSRSIFRRNPPPLLSSSENWSLPCFPCFASAVVSGPPRRNGSATRSNFCFFVSASGTASVVLRFPRSPPRGKK